MPGRNRLMISLITLGMAWIPLACGGVVSSGGGGSSSATGSSGSSGAGGSATASSGTTTSSGGGATSSSTGASSGAVGSSATSSSATSSTSSGGCGDCMGFQCCGSTCVNEGNDINHCGSCGNTCPAPNPFCNHGICTKPPCDPGKVCAGTQECCGSLCCNPGELCCSVPGPLGDMLQCTAPTPEGTCPKGCLGCVCASPDTPIATPLGDRPIAELAAGDLVYSVRGQSIDVVPILRVNKVEAHDHHVVHVDLDSGAALEVSPRHPTADGRTFADLKPGDRMGQARVIAVRLIPYRHPYTHDILPDSDTGTYFAAGALIGSTLFGTVNVGRAAAQ